MLREDPTHFDTLMQMAAADPRTVEVLTLLASLPASPFPCPTASAQRTPLVLGTERTLTLPHTVRTVAGVCAATAALRCQLDAGLSGPHPGSRSDSGG